MRMQDALADGRIEPSVNGAAVVTDAFDLIFEKEFFAFEFDHPQVVDGAMMQAVVDLGFECLMLTYKFRQMRLQRHPICLLNLQWPLSPQLSLTQTQCKNDATPARRFRQSVAKWLIARNIYRPLSRSVKIVIIVFVTLRRADHAAAVTSRGP